MSGRYGCLRFALFTGMLSLLPVLPAWSTSPVTPNFTGKGVLMDAATGASVEGLSVVVYPLVDGHYLSDEALDEIVREERFLDTRAGITNPDGSYAAHFTFLGVPTDTSGLGCLCIFQPGGCLRTELQMVTVYVRQAETWFKLDVDVTADAVTNLDTFPRQVALPIILVSADGLRLSV